MNSILNINLPVTFYVVISKSLTVFGYILINYHYWARMILLFIKISFCIACIFSSIVLFHV